MRLLRPRFAVTGTMFHDVPDRSSKDATLPIHRWQVASVPTTTPETLAVTAPYRHAKALRTPDGAIVEDRRETTFTPRSWRVSASFLQAHRPAARAALGEHARALGLHAVRHGIGMAGDGLLRLSCDLAPGAAATLLALPSSRALTDVSEAPANLDLPLLVEPASNTALTFATARTAHTDGRR